MNEEGKRLAEAWADLRASLVAILEPPLARAAGWLNRLFSR